MKKTSITTEENSSNKEPDIHTKQRPVSDNVNKTGSPNYLVFIITALLLFAGVTFYLLNKSQETSSHTDGSVSNQIQDDNLEANSKPKSLSGQQKVASSLGFSLSYNANEFIAYAETTDHTPTSPKYTITGQFYESSETSEIRDYSIIKFKYNDADQKKSGYDFTMITNIRKSYWNKRTVMPENSGKSKLDIYVEEMIASITEESEDHNISIPEKTTINGTEFTKFIESFSNSANPSSVTEYIYYVTVQNDRPYQIIMTVQNDANYESNMAKLETILNTVTFEGLDVSKLAQ